MRRRSGVRGAMAIALAGAVVAACGGGGADFPSRDWTGHYQSTMSGSKTDCEGAPLPPPLSGFTLTLEQTPDNRATVRMGTFVRLDGTFHGDSLVATRTLEAPIDLPDSLRARVTPADSIETIGYEFRAALADSAFTGRYVIRAPDLRALSGGGEAVRCSYTYEVRGRQDESVPTIPGGGVEIGGGEVSPPAGGTGSPDGSR